MVLREASVAALSEDSSVAILETQSLTKQFGGLAAIEKVNFSLRVGEIRAIIGPNGAGKTTFFNLVTGVLTPTRGKILFKGTEITRLRPFHRVKLGIGRSFQLINIFPELSIRENVEIAVQACFKKKTSPFELIDRSEVRTRAQEILERFEWVEESRLAAGALPHAGQKRLETILALASEPALLLLDEPTAGLDENEISFTMNLIKETSQNRTVLLTDHDVKFIMRIASRITVLHQGRIIAEGVPSEVATNREVEEAYFGGIN